MDIIALKISDRTEFTAIDNIPHRKMYGQKSHLVLHRRYALWPLS
jgi:hypothetical protein